MTKKSLLLYPAFVLFVAVGCGPVMVPGVHVTQRPELRGGNVEYSASVALPPKALRDGSVYEVKLFYAYGSKEAEVGVIALKSDDYPNAKKEVSKKTAKLTFPYLPGMERGELRFNYSLTKLATGKVKANENKTKIADGLVTTSLLVVPAYVAVYAFHGYNDQEELIPNRVSFYFPQGISRITRVEKRRKEIKQFDAFIASRNVTRTVLITGMHSPEGTESINSALAPARAAAVEVYYRKRMDAYDYDQSADKIEFKRSATVRDYAAFRELLREYKGISEKSKEEVVAIIDGGGSFEDREKALQNLSVYRKLFRDLYPVLRTAETVALSVKNKFSNPEILSLSKEVGLKSKDNPALLDTLSVEELLYGADKNPILAEKIAIYRAVLQKGENWVARNNLGATFLAQAIQEDDPEARDARNGLIDEANKQFEISVKAGGQLPEVTVNLGVTYLLQGDTVRAYNTLQEALQQAPSPATSKRINALKGALEIKQGDYAAAQASLNVATLSHAARFNKGLVSLLLKDPAAAEVWFQELLPLFPGESERSAVDNLTYAKAHYALAIALARQGKRTGILEGLQNAVAADPTLKERAISDLEFGDYGDIVRQL